MTKDQHILDQEEKYQDARQKVICQDAAIFVMQGYSRGEAIQKAEDICQAQEEAEADLTRAKGTLAEAQSPSPKPGTEAQVAAIAAELFQQKN